MDLYWIKPIYKVISLVVIWLIVYWVNYDEYLKKKKIENHLK